jgi:hypothetical protein
MSNQTLIFPSAINSNVNAISATAATPKNMQIMNIVCSMKPPVNGDALTIIVRLAAWNR